ncbi:MAG: 4-hydroxy-tetrahydrodipicolinate reductase [Proteobacteria bacterium]|nr:4-hydroxy-tetrahydrodipicolinate reductase [Pseudomonadota bacterium]
MTTRIGIAGCGGRVGRLLIRTIHETPGASVAAGSVRPEDDAVGRDLGELAGIAAIGVVATGSAQALFEASDVVIDFTTPQATLEHAAIARATGTAMVIGTTGIEAAGRAELEEAAGSTAIVLAANMSLGINLLLGITRRIAAALDEDFDIEIVEMHHRHKADAPSGTALALGRAAAHGRGVDHDAVAVRGRDGITGARRRGDIGYAVLRGGNVVGAHSVVFAADNEHIEITHRAADRAIFARGAVTAALWARGQPPGLYGMADVLGL